MTAAQQVPPQEVPGQPLRTPRPGEAGHVYMRYARLLVVAAIATPLLGTALFFGGARLDGEAQNVAVSAGVVMISLWGPLLMSALSFRFQASHTLYGRPHPWLNHVWGGIGALMSVPVAGAVGAVVLLGGVGVIVNTLMGW